MPNLEKLWLSSNNIGDEGCRTIAPALRTMTNLKTLNLSDNNIGDDSIAVLCSRVLPEISLEYLGLYGNKIGNVGCQSLLELVNNGSLPSLNELWLHNNPNISSELKIVFKRDWKAKGKYPEHLFF
jgi:Ran GTPase-activating protein (RanGAP) involved in mRNA processing and transport